MCHAVAAMRRQHRYKRRGWRDARWPQGKIVDAWLRNRRPRTTQPGEQCVDFARFVFTDRVVQVAPAPEAPRGPVGKAVGLGGMRIHRRRLKRRCTNAYHAHMGLFLFSALVHAYVGLRLLPALTQWPWAVALFGLLLGASAVLMPLGFYARRAKTRRAQIVGWAGLLLMGLFSSLFVLTLLRDVVLALAHLAQVAGLITVSRAQLANLDVGSAILVPVVALAITALGLRNARRTAAVVSVEVPIRNLPDALNGFTIAQISDIHVGPTIKRPYVEAIVAAVNQ